MVIPVSVADKDGLHVPQNVPNIIWLAAIRAKESTHLAPSSFAGFKQNTAVVRDPNKVSGNSNHKTHSH